MRTVVTYESSSLAATHRLALRIGNRLRGSEVVELHSDVGGGKTTFVQGFAAGAGSRDRVSSPSFTIRNEYRTPSLTIYHFDFYRLGEAGIMREELVECLHDPSAVTVIEWGDIIHDVLPEQRLSITIRVTAETARSFTFDCPVELAYLVEGI